MASVLGAFGATIAAAEIVRETERYERKRVLPNELITREIGCSDGALTGGGYWLANAEDTAFAVIANFPLATGQWRVGVRNVSDQNQTLNLRIYALCDTD